MAIATEQHPTAATTTPSTPSLPPPRPATPTATPPPATATPDGRRWIDDLHWHRRQRRQARIQWTGEDILDILTRRTGGQLDFTTLADLAILTATADALAATIEPVQRALITRMGITEAALTGKRTRPSCGPWPQTCTVLGIDDSEAAILTAAAHDRLPSAGDRGSENPDTAAGHLAVARALDLPETWRSPLLEAWELKQVWRMYDEAAAMVEDTTCDLAEELLTRGRTSVSDSWFGGGVLVDDVLEVVGVSDPAALAERIDRRMRARGRPGDPRRAPVQVF